MDLLLLYGQMVKTAADWRRKCSSGDHQTLSTFTKVFNLQKSIKSCDTDAIWFMHFIWDGGISRGNSGKSLLLVREVLVRRSLSNTSSVQLRGFIQIAPKSDRGIILAMHNRVVSFSHVRLCCLYYVVCSFRFLEETSLAMQFWEVIVL